MNNNDENWEKNEPIISGYGIQTWKKGKRTPEHLVSVTHNGISLNNMLNEARADERMKRYIACCPECTHLNEKCMGCGSSICRTERGTAKEIFEELDSLCGNTGIGLGLDLEDSLSSHARSSDEFRKALTALKTRMGIE